MSESRFDLASLLRADLSELHAYVPHGGHFEVRLDANECPPLLSPDAARALADAMTPGEFNRYPDARHVELRKAIADSCGAHPDEVLAGVGSDEVIALLLTALDRPRHRGVAPTLLTPTPTFVMYRMSGRARGFRATEVPLDKAWDLDVNAMRKAVEFARPNVVFIATPNNPTGNRMSLDRIEAVIEAAADALVIVDEAYIDFAVADDGAEDGPSSARAQSALRHKYPNVAILRTLSKIGFAALRIGWLIGAPELVREIDKVRQPYNIPVPSQRGATFVLRELGGEVARIRDVVVAERRRLGGALARLGFNVSKSDANFLWVDAPGSGRDLHARLAARGVLVKYFQGSAGRMANRMRITVGLPGENDRLLAEIAAGG